MLWNILHIVEVMCVHAVEVLVMFTIILFLFHLFTQIILIFFTFSFFNGQAMSLRK